MRTREHRISADNERRILYQNRRPAAFKSSISRIVAAGGERLSFRVSTSPGVAALSKGERKKRIFFLHV